MMNLDRVIIRSSNSISAVLSFHIHSCMNYLQSISYPWLCVRVCKVSECVPLPAGATSWKLVLPGGKCSDDCASSTTIGMMLDLNSEVVENDFSQSREFAQLDGQATQFQWSLDIPLGPAPI